MEFPAHLAARRIFSSLSNSTCPSANEDGPTIVPVVGSLTFHSLAIIISGAACVLVWVVSLFNIINHASHYSVPAEQRQIIRVIFLIPWFSLVAFLSVWLEGAAPYFKNALDVGESMALSSFFLLLCNYIVANEGGLENLLNGVSAKNQSTPNVSSLKKSFYMVFQFIPISILLWIATAASMAAGTYCPTSNSLHFTHIWITVIGGISTGAAIIATLRFYSLMKPELAQHKIFLKLLSFKGVVGLNFLQGLIINFLVSSNKIHTTKYLTYHDVTVGILMLILSLEMPIFAFLILYSFSCQPYKRGSSRYYGGPLGTMAIFKSLLFTDLLSAFVGGPVKYVREAKASQKGEEGVAFVSAQPYVGRGRYDNVPNPPSYDGPYDRLSDNESGQRYEGMRYQHS